MSEPTTTVTAAPGAPAIVIPVADLPPGTLITIQVQIPAAPEPQPEPAKQRQFLGQRIQ